MNIEGDIHGALMARVETISGYPILWPQKGGARPPGEHLSVFHLPNDNQRPFLSDDVPRQRKGFLVLTLVSPLGGYEAVTRRKAGEIEAHFPLGYIFKRGAVSLRVHNASIKPGREVSGRWETPIWIDYRGLA